jgi:hypothetical protein
MLESITYFFLCERDVGLIICCQPRILQNLSKQQLKTHFIKDENRIFPNEQEITVYLSTIAS